MSVGEFPTVGKGWRSVEVEVVVGAARDKTISR